MTNKKERQIAFSVVLGFIDEQGTIKRIAKALGIDYSVARMEVAQEHFQKIGVDFTGLNTSGDWKELLEDEKEEEKIFDLSQVADGVLICATDSVRNIAITLRKDHHLAFAKDKKCFRLDTVSWNAWRGGECPFGQPEAVEIEFELRESKNGKNMRVKGDGTSVPWIHYGEGGDVVAYRVIGLVDPWRYPE